MGAGTSVPGSRSQLSGVRRDPGLMRPGWMVVRERPREPTWQEPQGAAESGRQRYAVKAPRAPKTTIQMTDRTSSMGLVMFSRVTAP